MNSNSLNPAGSVVLPGQMVPSFRTSVAIQTGSEKNLLFRTWGGIGDQICAEPTIRFALKTFKGCDVSLASEHPEFFAHLTFKNIYDLGAGEKPAYEKYLLLDTIVDPTHLTWEFMSHMVTNCVDFPSLCALRCQLPIADREVKLTPKDPTNIFETTDRDVWVHAGKHWPSKTFPKDWWDAVLTDLLAEGARPVLIGADTDDNRGTVDVNVTGCLDLRNKLSLNDSIWYLQRAKVLLTNDSSPLHMAVSGDAHIGFIATCKHPDYITHWRHGQWSWRMQNLGRGGIWDQIDYCPNKAQTVEVDKVPEELLRSWLPGHKVFAEWAVARLEDA